MSPTDIINPIQWFSGCILLILALHGFKYREKEIARGLIGFLVLCSVWSFCVALMAHPKELEFKILINKIKLFAIFPIPYFVLQIALSFMEEGSKVKKILRQLWVVPLAFGVLNFSFHELFFNSYFINAVTGQLHYNNGTLFGLHYALARIVFIMSFVIIWRGSAGRQPFHRKTATLIMLAIIIPFVVDSTVTNILPELRFYQLTPVAFMLTGLILVYAIFSHKGLEVFPYSRSRIIDDLKTPCLMWGKNEELVDCNTAGSEIFKMGSTLSIENSDIIKELKIDGKEVKVSDRYYRVTYSAINNDNKTKSGGYTILTDVTDSHMVEAELKRISKFKTDVLSVISHDMSGMLGLLSLNADVLYHNFDKLSDQTKASMAEKICEQAREINRFTTDLVEWSRDQFGQESFAKQKINLLEIALEVVTEVRALAEIKKQRLEIDIDKDLLIISNAKLLEIVLRNLVLNAIKHGLGESVIGLSFSSQEIIVTNSGVFKDYQRLNLFFIDQEKNTYSGLGLKICKEFCQVLDCWVEFAISDQHTFAKIKGIEVV